MEARIPGSWHDPRPRLREHVLCTSLHGANCCVSVSLPAQTLRPSENCAAHDKQEFRSRGVPACRGAVDDGYDLVASRLIEASMHRLRQLERAKATEPRFYFITTASHARVFLAGRLNLAVVHLFIALSSRGTCCASLPLSAMFN